MLKLNLFAHIHHFINKHLICFVLCCLNPLCYSIVRLCLANRSCYIIPPNCCLFVTSRISVSFLSLMCYERSRHLVLKIYLHVPTSSWFVTIYVCIYMCVCGGLCVYTTSQKYLATFKNFYFPSKKCYLQRNKSSTTMFLFIIVHTSLPQ